MRRNRHSSVGNIEKSDTKLGYEALVRVPRPSIVIFPNGVLCTVESYINIFLLTNR